MRFQHQLVDDISLPGVGCEEERVQREHEQPPLRGERIPLVIEHRTDSRRVKDRTVAREDRGLCHEEQRRVKHFLCMVAGPTLPGHRVHSRIALRRIVARRSVSSIQTITPSAPTVEPGSE